MQWCFLSVIVVLLIAFSGCKEEKDDSPPVVTITEPADGLDLFLPDSLTIRGTVTDDGDVTSVTIQLVDSDLFQTGVSRTVSLSPSGEFNAQLLIEDKEIRSGPHFIQVSATDGTNLGRDFLNVQIFEVPRVFRGLVVAVAEGSSSDYILLETDGSQTLLFSAPDAHQLMAIDQIEGKVFHTTSEEASIQVINIDGPAHFALEPPLAAQDGSYYTDLIYDRAYRELTISTADREIRRYSPEGLPRGFVTLEPGTTAGQLTSDGERIYAEISNANGSNTFLRLYDRFSLTQQGEELLPFPLDHIIQQQGDRRLLVGQEGGLRSILTYDLSSGDFVSRSTNGATPVRAVSRQDENALLAYDDQLFRFSPSSQQLIPLAAGPVQALAYDDQNGVAFIAEGAVVTAYGITPWSPIDSWTLSGEVQAMSPLYNK